MCRIYIIAAPSWGRIQIGFQRHHFSQICTNTTTGTQKLAGTFCSWSCPLDAGHKGAAWWALWQPTATVKFYLRPLKQVNAAMKLVSSWSGNRPLGSSPRGHTRSVSSFARPCEGAFTLWRRNLFPIYWTQNSRNFWKIWIIEAWNSCLRKWNLSLCSGLIAWTENSFPGVT